MPVTLTPTLVQTGSHWLELERGPRLGAEPFSKEEVYPILELDVPRVGFVRASFEASRYVASSYDEVWSDWRIHLRDVRTPDAERPDLPHLGRDAAGVGPATRSAITDACRPVIREWLDSDGYRRSRRKVAAHTVRRELDAPRDYQLQRARETLERIGHELSPTEATHLRETIGLLAQAATNLEREPIA